MVSPTFNDRNNDITWQHWQIDQGKNGESVPHLEITEVVLVRCNVVNNNYQHDSRLWYTFFAIKSSGQLSDIWPILKYGLHIKILNC